MRTQTAATGVRVDGQGIEPRQGRTGIEQQHDIPQHPPFFFKHKGLGIGPGQEVTKAASTETVDSKGTVLNGNQGVQVLRPCSAYHKSPLYKVYRLVAVESAIG